MASQPVQWAGAPEVQTCSSDWVAPRDVRKQRRVNLGHPRHIDGTPVLALAEARAKAREVKKLAAEGKPLVPDDAGQPNADTFRILAADCLTTLPRTSGISGICSRQPWPTPSVAGAFALRSRDDERGKAGEEPARCICVTEILPPPFDVGGVEPALLRVRRIFDQGA
jgi:hypothetical protein